MSTYLGRPSNDTSANRVFNGVYHYGTDWGWGQGDTVYAMAGGFVSDVMFLKDYGWIIRIDHGYLCDGKRTFTRYCHLATGSALVYEGQLVKRGDPIAKMGATGTLAALLTGTPVKHLHSELWLNGVRVDEQPYQKKEVPPMAANDRTVRSDIRAVVRADTTTTAVQVDLLDVNSTHPILGWKRGQAVTAHGITTDAWFKLGEKQWASAVGFTNTTTAGIVDLNPVVPAGTPATRSEVEAIVKASEGRIIAAIPTAEQIAIAVDALSKTEGH